MKSTASLSPNAEKALAVLEDPFQDLQVTVVVNGTAFQKKVWRLLGDYGVGRQTTYGQLAARLSVLKGARAVGTALGANPVAFFIPCHRVLNANGASGHFRWGASRKKAMLDWERSLLLPGE